MVGHRVAEPPGARRGCGDGPVAPVGGQKAVESQGRALVSDGTARQEGLLWGAGHRQGTMLPAEGQRGLLELLSHMVATAHGCEQPLKVCFCWAG